ncbi:hypothetical protein [Kalamiella sp. sgz302252]|uniref:hypothetical protein n=1 Tax=Pantoea sp. sgz302252 TaxID=3341827 RepID=UPI0036D2996D
MNNFAPDKSASMFDFPLLSRLIVRELKRQHVTYEEMALQINVSLSTFKRMISDPGGARAANLHSLLHELGIRIWLER